jgi:phospholipase/carboxylesterase
MRSCLSGVAILCCVSLVLAGAAQAPQIVDYPNARLRAVELDAGDRPLVLLHGFASSPQDWLPLVGAIRRPPATHLIFPEAPNAQANGTGRGWWPLDLASHRDGTGLPDLSRTRPTGLAAAAARVQILLEEITARIGNRPGDVAVGGFSQGAMVSAEIAFRSDTPLRALILLSPTVVDEASWRDGIPVRRGLPVFIAHGRQDEVLPFSSSARLAETLRTAGLDVTWVPFDGAHEIPRPVADALGEFLTHLDR